MFRFFDLIFSILCLLILAPLMIPVIIILCLTGEGKVFFLQERVGKGGETFLLYKFATMLKNSPNIGTRTLTVKNDPRVLPFGKFLRKTKVNELPQILNIIKGDMSLIGPRPLTQAAINAYPSSSYKKVIKLKPGLSGIGSIIFRNEEEILSGVDARFSYYSEVIAPFKGELEAWYYQNKSLYIYFMAIIVTIFVVIVPKSNLPWKVFPSLPTPPEILKDRLYFQIPK